MLFTRIRHLDTGFSSNCSSCIDQIDSIIDHASRHIASVNLKSLASLAVDFPVELYAITVNPGRRNRLNVPPK